MTQHEVGVLVEKEARSALDKANRLGLKLRECIVTPRKERFTSLDGIEGELWIVAEEDPGARNGYVVTFDERSGEFGVGTRNIFSEYVALRCSGTLSECWGEMSSSEND